MTDQAPPHRRRPRYAGKHPRRFEDKYKEHDPERFPETVAKVLASGKTPAGSHVPIMVDEVVEVLAPRPGALVVDCTLGHGGHAAALLPRLLPGGCLLGLDVDPVELPRTETRLRALGFGPDVLRVRRSNFGGLERVLAAEGIAAVDAVFADLGVSSMQLDAPGRGFSMKWAGPLDMRMNPARGQTAAEWLERVTAARLAKMLAESADEPHADLLARTLAGRTFALTTDLADAIRAVVPRIGSEEQELTVRRVFQAIRIAVNDEFSALEALVRSLPACLAPGGRAAFLTFHSGEDRRVKQAFQDGLRQGVYEEAARRVLRASPEECRANPRARPAKLRWAVRSSVPARTLEG